MVAWRLAVMYRLKSVELAAVRFCETEFKKLVDSEEWGSFSKEEIKKLLISDGLVAEEDFVCESVMIWNKKSDSYENIEDILDHVRYHLCSTQFIKSIENNEKYRVVKESPAFLNFKSMDNSSNHLNRAVRCRGTNDILVTHYDASEHLYAYNPNKEEWSVVADIPFGGGYEYAATASKGQKLYLVGGRSKDGRSLRSVFCLDFEKMNWNRLSDMHEIRWYHGSVIVGSRLYAVAGCGQLDSVEFLELDSSQGVADSWQLVSPMASPRHMPGVGVLDSNIYVCGGTDDSWTAFATVEALSTESGEWQRLPDMLVPR